MDSRTKSDLQRLTKKRATIAPLGNVAAPDSIPAQTGASTGTVVSGGSGGGIASPLTETSRTTINTKSSDGIFTWGVPDDITFIDANGNEVVLNLSVP